MKKINEAGSFEVSLVTENGLSTAVLAFKHLKFLSGGDQETSESKTARHSSSKISLEYDADELLEDFSREVIDSVPF
ncbi:MAG TPA: hypothetical protein VLB46_11065 [Pyrinomonadaceae bacterium]|nr:hypothetical protein [Pyrinomonadaceae bacterium]